MFPKGNMRSPEFDQLKYSLLFTSLPYLQGKKSELQQEKILLVTKNVLQVVLSNCVPYNLFFFKYLYPQYSLYEAGWPNG